MRKRTSAAVEGAAETVLLFMVIPTGNFHYPQGIKYWLEVVYYHNGKGLVDPNRKHC